MYAFAYFSIGLLVFFLFFSPYVGRLALFVGYKFQIIFPTCHLCFRFTYNGFCCAKFYLFTGDSFPLKFSSLLWFLDFELWWEVSSPLLNYEEIHPCFLLVLLWFHSLYFNHRSVHLEFITVYLIYSFFAFLYFANYYVIFSEKTWIHLRSQVAYHYFQRLRSHSFERVERMQWAEWLFLSLVCVWIWWNPVRNLVLLFSLECLPKFIFEICKSVQIPVTKVS